MPAGSQMSCQRLLPKRKDEGGKRGAKAVGAAARGRRIPAYADSQGRLINRGALRTFTIRPRLADAVSDTLVGVAREIGCAVIPAAEPLAAA